MMLSLTPGRLTGGARLADNLLTFPAAGGGVSLPELRGTASRFLNLTLTVEEEHSLALELRVYGPEEDCRVLVRFGLMPRIRAHMAIDLNWLDGHVLFPGHMPGTLKVVCHGSRIAREEIRRAELVSMPAFHDVHVRLDAEDGEEIGCFHVGRGAECIKTRVKAVTGRHALYFAVTTHYAGWTGDFFAGRCLMEFKKFVFMK